MYIYILCRFGNFGVMQCFCVYAVSDEKKQTFDVKSNANMYMFRR